MVYNLKRCVTAHGILESKLLNSSLSTFTCRLSQIRSSSCAGEKPGNVWPPAARSTFTRTSASLSAPDFLNVAIVLSASEYTRVTRNVSPVSSFFHNCPIWIFDTLFAISRLYVHRTSVSTGSPHACILQGKPVSQITRLRLTACYRAAFRLAPLAALALLEVAASI